MAPRSSKLSISLWIVGIAVALIALHWGWVRAWWVYPSISEQQRLESFNETFTDRPRRAVAARLDSGGMTILARSDIAQVQPSRCARDSDCSEAMFWIGRRSYGCSYVTVRFHCAFAIKTADGRAATAFAQISSNRNYSVGVSIPGSPKPFETEQPSFDDTNAKLCELGLGCKRGAPAQGGAQASPGTDVAPPPPRSGESCDGIRADVVGTPEACLDPREPARRSFRDCRDGFCGPAMVALPKGRVLRGSSAADMARLRHDDPKGEAYRRETPQREVAIEYQLAAGRFEVTFEEWDACLADGGCTRRPEDPGNRTRGRRPVIHVSWLDATNEFLPWLNRKLGLSGASAYRLLTEAEWEYAARAGTTTKFAFGDIISTAQANFYGREVVEVGSYAPNGFGLHDMHGNIAEWVQDCSKNDYDGVPVDGSAYVSRDCSRVHRGGSWNDVPFYLRSAHRGSTDPRNRSGQGFRVARTLTVR
jgi:formylglycine-generating enzyme required for sulfatase activity